jgi:hypothetical protein
VSTVNGSETAVVPSTEIGAAVDFTVPNWSHKLYVAPDLSAAYSRNATPISDDND